MPPTAETSRAQPFRQPPDVVAEVEAFLRAEPAVPGFQTLEERVSYLVKYQARLHAAGLAVPAWPVEYGGRGLDVRDAVAVAEALGAGGAPELINFVATDVVGPALLAFGDPTRLTSWLPKMADATEIWCQLFSEPDAGSDLTSLRTRASRVRDGWLINGQKVWCTWAQFATYGLLLARTGSSEDRHRGITAFVIDMGTPGTVIRPLRTMTGTSEFAEVFFNDVTLPSDAVIGEVNRGWAVAQAMLNAERGTYAIRRAAVIAAALGRTMTAARDSDLSADDRQAFARAFTAIRLLQLRVAKVADLLAAGADIGSSAALTKLLMTNAEQEVFAFSLRMVTPTSMAWEKANAASVVEEYLYSRAASIYGGTTQIQLNLLGERVLGLPR